MRGIPVDGQRLVRAVLWLAWWLVAALGIIYLLFWLPWRGTMLGDEAVREAVELIKPVGPVSAQTMRRLGALLQQKSTSFLHFEQDKRPGVTRFCALGDSFTQGDEVGDGQDYPAYLQELLRTYGARNTEVLNFGNGWYGFSQVYVMWTEVAIHYQCDYVLLLPRFFWHSRDTTFNHADGKFGYLHSRLVYEQGKLSLLDPLGETGEERLRAYNRAIPHWHYLRYDRHPRNLLDAPFRGERRLPNPFYHDWRRQVPEAWDIYRAVISDIAASAPRVLVLLGQDEVSVYPRLLDDAPANVAVAQLIHPPGFPYITPGSHFSGFGNQATAMAFYQLLSGDPSTGILRAGVTDLTQPGSGPVVPLRDYAQAWLDDSGRRIGYVARANFEEQYRHDLHVTTLRDDGIAAVLALVRPGYSIAYGCLLPLASVPQGALRLDMMAGDGTSVTTAAAGPLRPGLAVYKAEVPGLSLERCALVPSAVVAGDMRRARRMLLDGELVAEVEAGGKLVPAHGQPLHLRASGEYRDSIFELLRSRERVISLVLRAEHGETVRYPLLRLQPQVYAESFSIDKPLRR